MSKFLQKRGLWTRYKDDTKGNFALIWAFGLTATLVSVGAGLDLSTTARVTTTSQAAADQVALTAAVFYSSYERLPENSEEGFVDNQIYRADDAGFNFPNSVHGGNRRVRIRANYNEEDGYVDVAVTGRVRTNFMGMFNRKFRTIPFSSTARANFKEVAIKNPASITLVLDNSGSMSWDDKPAECERQWQQTSSWSGRWVDVCESPSDADRRIDGLTASVENFMDTIDGFVGPQSVTGRRVLRTGMIPYDDSIIQSREVDMKWGIISDTQINRMRPSGSTNSAPPIAKAWDWLQDENDVHEAETGEDNPLRYMIFMTDGQNSATPRWYELEGTEYWRGQYCYTRNGRTRCRYYYDTSPTRPNWGYGMNWEEGELISPSDRDSKNTCTAMKAQGVRVFTIGFALEPGIYMTNYRDTFKNDYYSENDTRTISSSTTDAAYSMLADCASSADDFVRAEDANSLDHAFRIIGETIVEDVIRLSE